MFPYRLRQQQVKNCDNHLDCKFAKMPTEFHIILNFTPRLRSMLLLLLLLLLKSVEFDDDVDSGV